MKESLWHLAGILAEKAGRAMLFGCMATATCWILHVAPVDALVIASIGDSFASGEGNPDRPQRFKEIMGIKYVEAGPIWSDRQCHRSHMAAPEIAANDIARILNEPLTFIALACTGAAIDPGIITPYDPNTDNLNNALPSQIDALVSMVNNQPIDILLISAGGNDIGFSDLIKDCVKTDGTEYLLGRGPLCSQNTEVTTRVERQLRELPHKYDRLAEQLKRLRINQVYIMEYPDPTKGANGEYCGEGGNERIIYFLHPKTARWAHDNVLVRLNATLNAAAHKHGWMSVPTMSWSIHNGLCAEDARWFRSESEAREIQGPYEYGLSPRDLLKPGVQFSMGSVHPNPTGHNGIARQIVSTYLDRQKSLANRHQSYKLLLEMAD